MAHKAILVPTAHDEPFLYMEIFRRLCRLPRHIIYLTHAEQELVQRITGNRAVPSSVLALGIDPPASPGRNVSAKNTRYKAIFCSMAGASPKPKTCPNC